MTDSTQASPLTFVPIPLATGDYLPSPDGERQLDVSAVSVLVELADGSTQTRPLERRDTGWWLPGTSN